MHLRFFAALRRSVLLFALASAAQVVHAACVFDGNFGGVNQFTCSGDVNGTVVAATAGDDRFIFADGTFGSMALISGGAATRDELVFTAMTVPVFVDLTNQAAPQMVTGALTIHFQAFGGTYFRGGQADDVFVGTAAGSDRIDGGPGADVLDGGGGGDTQASAVFAECSIDTVTNVATDNCQYVSLSNITVPPNGTYGPGDVLNFTVTYAVPVNVTGTPFIPLTIGALATGASYASGSGTTTLVFSHTVAAGESDADGITVGAAIDLNGGTIRDAGAHDAPTSLAAAPSTAGVLVSSTSTTFTGPSPTGGGNITASFTGGGPGCTFSVAQFIPLTGHAASPPAGSAPGQVIFPFGLFDFTTSGCVPGSSITMTVTYPRPLAPSAQYWKYGPTPSNATPHWYVLPANISGNTAVFTIADGGLGDDDRVANGTIVDQGGPGVPTLVVPTLSQWAMLLLALMLAGVAAPRLRVSPRAS